MSKQISFKKVLVVFFFIIEFHCLGSTIAHSSEINNQDRNTISSTKKIKTNISHKYTKNFLLTKKTGGRSGGGSFNRSKPSPSNSRRSDSQDSYSSPSNSSPSHNSSESTDSISFLIAISTYALCIMILYILFVIVVRVLIRFKIIQNNTYNYQNHSFSTNDTDYIEPAYDTYDRERDNDRITVSLLQIVLNSGETENIKQDLNKLNIEVDTSTNEGLMKLMQETAVILLRNEKAWIYTFSSSESLDISQAKPTFDRLSIAERSKFSRETLNNIDGELETTEIDRSQTNRDKTYIVVTLIAGTADDNPLFGKIYATEELKDALVKIASMRDDYLMKFELLWTPQQDNEYLTADELLVEYSNLVMLA